MRGLFIFWSIVLIIAISPSVFAASAGVGTGSMKIAVKSFETRGIITADESTFLTDVLQGELLRRKEFIIVDRTRTKQVLDDMGISQDGCTSVECLVKIGKLLNVDKIISGTIGKIGQMFVVTLQVVNVTDGRIQAIKTANHEGTVEGLSPVVIDLARQISTQILEQAPGDAQSKSGGSIFDPPVFSDGTFNIDVTFYGSDYIKNNWSRTSLSPYMLSISYALTPNFFATATACLLKGNYALQVPENKQIISLLNGRSTLWGDGLGSYGVGLGGGYRTWRIRGGANFILFISKDTDMSPNALIELHAEYYIVRSIYVGLSMVMFNGTGLLNPDRVGPQVSSSDYGISRRSWASPTAILFKVGVDL